MANSKILTAEQERALRQPIDDMLWNTKELMHSERRNYKVVECQSAIAGIKRDKTLSKGEKEQK